MKKWIALSLVLVLLLGGCAQEPKPTEETPPTQTTPAPTEPEIDSPYPLFLNYEYEHPLELTTGSAVGVYPMGGEGYYALEIMGEGVVLFSGNEKTTLTALSEQGRYTVELSCLLEPSDGSVRITEKGVGYYDDADHSIVFLDPSLQETARITMPQDLSGSLVLSADWESVYYFSDSALRCLELNSGISRLLKECAFPAQAVTALHFDGTVLECAVTDGDEDRTMFVSTQTGEMLFMGGEFPELSTAGDFYFAQWFDGFELRNIFGIRSGTAQYLVPAAEGLGLYALPVRQVAAVCGGDEAGAVIDHYDLTAGTRSASVRLDGVWEPVCLTEDPARGLIWFLGGDAKGVTNTLYCWDPVLTPAEDEQSYIQPHYTDENPDTDGLEACAKAAQELAGQYRIRIRLWEDAVNVMPEDYTFGIETRVNAYEHYLAVLEQALSVYPEEIFKRLGKISENGYLTVNLVRSAWGSTELGSLEQAGGVHFWHKGSAYVTLVMDDGFEQTFHHELFHAIDSYVLTQTLAYDFWNDLNPKGFRYDLSYIANQSREDWQYLEEDSRSFIDMYAMSFPKEDRARIMEYAVMPGNEQYFASKTMQKKLDTLCDGIREAFKLKGDEYLWEQYLT